MAKERNGRESTTSTLPVSTILNLLQKHEKRIGLQNERLPEAKAVIETLKQEQYPDTHTIRAAQERVRIWTREWRWFNLLKVLAHKIEANPYPGQHIRLYALAQKILPDVNKQEWYEIFYWFNVTNTMVCTPVEVTEIDVETLEEQLIRRVNEDNVILAIVLREILQCTPRSKQYLAAKDALEQRGWEWAHYRSGQSTHRIIRPPVKV